MSRRVIAKLIGLGAASSSLVVWGSVGCASTAQLQDFFYREIASVVATAIALIVAPPA
jgi:hypothetical protein